MLRRSLIVVVLVILTACGGSDAEVDQIPEDLQIIRLPMGFIPNIQYAPFYVAVEKGYFAEAGFEIEFDYSFETDGVALVGANQTPFAIASGEQVLIARSQEIPVVYVTAWFQDFPVAVVVIANSGVETPEDLAGKQIGLPGLFGANYIGLRALLDYAGVPEEDVTLNSIGFNQVEAFVGGQEQIIVGYISNEPIQLKAQGYDVDVIPVRDYVQLVANGIITNETVINDDPEMIDRFVGAFLKGLSDTIENPNEAFEISKNYVEGLEGLDESVQNEVLALSIEFWLSEKLGYSNPEAWENMQVLLLNMGLLVEPLNLEDVYTNDFVE